MNNHEKFVYLVEIEARETLGRRRDAGYPASGTTAAVVWEAMCVDPACLPVDEPDGLYAVAVDFVHYATRQSEMMWKRAGYALEEYPSQPHWLRFEREPWK